MKSLKKLATFVALVAVLTFGMGASSCQEQVAHDVGVDTKVNADGSKTVTQTPVDQSPAGQAGGVVTAVLNTFLPGTGNLAHVALTGVLGLIASYFYAKQKTTAGQNTALQNSVDALNNGLTATGTAIQQAVNLLPPEHADTLNKVLVGIHTAQSVIPEIQHIIQPNLSTAGDHLPDPPAAAATKT
jgi:hypothetical protein